MEKIWCQKPISCRLRFSSMGRNDESTLLFNAPFFIFGPLRRPQGPQIINQNQNHKKITHFCHYVPWTKVPDDLNKSLLYILRNARMLFCIPSLYMDNFLFQTHNFSLGHVTTACKLLFYSFQRKKTRMTYVVHTASLKSDK